MARQTGQEDREMFRSTLPREERPSATAGSRRSSRFDPRSRVRSDADTTPIMSGEVFRSTLPREERPRAANARRTVPVFRSTLPREERRRMRHPNRNRRMFRSTLPREERPPIAKLIEDNPGFDPRSRVRSDAGI